MSIYRKFLSIAALAASVSLFGVSQASAIPFGPIAGPGNISNIDSAGAGTSVVLNVGQTGTITDLNLSINTDDTGANFWHDMDITLSHLGVSVVINVGNSIAAPGLFDVTIDDEASNPLPFGGDAIGSFKVDAASPDAGDGLSKFDGLELSGDWTLTFVDNSFFAGEGNYLVSWSLSGEVEGYVGVSEPGTLALFGLGLAGLGYARRRKSA